MPVVEVIQDQESLTLTIVAEFNAPLQRLWDIYADPRQLERIWGPPSHPATFVSHELSVGKTTTYYMTGPEGERFAGYWVITLVEEPTRLCFDDGFADEKLKPNPAMPISRNDYRFEDTGSLTRVTYISIYESRDALEQVLSMGVVEGTSSALNQIDALLLEKG